MDFAKRPKSAPTKRLLRLDPLGKVTAKRNFVVALNLLQSCMYGFFGVHEEECLNGEVDDMAMASNPLLLCLPADAFPPKMLAEQTAEPVIRAMVITGIEADLIPDVVVLEDVLEKLPLLSSAMAPGPSRPGSSDRASSACSVSLASVSTT